MRWCSIVQQNMNAKFPDYNNAKNNKTATALLPDHAQRALLMTKPHSKIRHEAHENHRFRAGHFTKIRAI